VKAIMDLKMPNINLRPTSMEAVLEEGRSCESDHEFENAEYKPKTYLDGGGPGGA
jgi:hypothetical protein